MTQTEALSELRAMLYEASAGFYTDVDLYKYLNSGQLEIINLSYGKLLAMQKADPSYQSDLLRQVETINSPSGIAGGTSTVTLPANFRFILSVILEADYGGLFTATKLSYSDFVRKEENSFTRATKRSPKYYIRGSVLGFSPVPESLGTIGYNYIRNPVDISSAQDFTLSAESHLAIVWFAYSYALNQNQRFQESVIARQTAINLIKDLL